MNCVSPLILHRGGFAITFTKGTEGEAALILTGETFNIKGENGLIEDEKKLLQARHRLEEAQVRNRTKERKARTRRLIQEGAIIEKVFPAAAKMDLAALEDMLYERLQ